MLWKYAATVSPNQSKGAFDSQLCASSNHQILSRYALLYAYQQHNMVQEYVSICFVWMDHRVTREYKHHNLWEKNVKGSTKQYPQDQCIIFMNIYQLIHQSKTSSKLNVRRVNIPFPLILWICCNSWDVNYRTIYWGKSLKITIYLHQVWCPPDHRYHLTRLPDQAFAANINAVAPICMCFKGDGRINMIYL